MKTPQSERGARKLTLKKESLRQLGRDELRSAEGGLTPNTQGFPCEIISLVASCAVIACR